MLVLSLGCAFLRCSSSCCLFPPFCSTLIISALSFISWNVLVTNLQLLLSPWTSLPVPWSLFIPGYIFPRLSPDFPCYLPCPIIVIFYPTWLVTVVVVLALYFYYCWSCLICFSIVGTPRPPFIVIIPNSSLLLPLASISADILWFLLLENQFFIAKKKQPRPQGTLGKPFNTIN